MTATTPETNNAGAAPPANHWTAFVSYSRRDSDFVQRLSADLAARGLTCWVDQSGLEPGSPDWEQAIRDAIRACEAVLLIASPSSRQSKYVADEVGIAQMYGRPVYPIWAEGDEWLDSIRLGMGSVQYVDARGGTYGTALDALVAQLERQYGRTFAPNGAAAEPDFEPRNPYKGLNPFSSADAGDFFGREADIPRLLEMLQRALEPGPDGPARVLAVVGPSGSGKSSLVMAGLVPALLQGALPGSERWRLLGGAPSPQPSPNPGRGSLVRKRSVTPIVPGSQPVEALALALAQGLPERSIASIREDLDDDTCRGLHRLLGMLAQPPTERVVLLLDQFEELFTQAADERERQQFAGLLLAAATISRGPGLIVLTLRADFYHHLMDYPDLWRLVQPHAWYVTPLTLDELREVVEAPARLPDTQLTLEGDLTGDMLFEVRDREAALPLLQFTLDQLFERRRGHLLTQAAYDEIGGVAGALGKHADEVFDGLPSDEHRRLAHELFLLLVHAGRGEDKPTRRRLVGELALAGATDTVRIREVAEAFVQARLLTAGTYGGQPTLELSHEALIQSWQRLQRWIREDPEGQRIQDELIERAQQWEQHQRDRSALYAGALLLEAQQWRQRRNPALGALERAFLEASEAEVARQQRERRRLRRALQSAAAVVAAAVLVLALLASFAAYQARISARNAVAHELAASATAQLQVDPHWALALALKAYDTCHGAPSLALPALPLKLPLPFAGACEHPENAGDRQVDVTLRQAVANSHLLSTMDTGGTPLAIWNGLDLIATRMPDNGVRIWDGAQQRDLPELPSQSAVNAAVFSADGKLLATGAADGTATVWDLSDLAHVVPLALAKHDCPVLSVQLWHDRLATVCGDGLARVWSIPAAGGPATNATMLFSVSAAQAPATARSAKSTDPGMITGVAFAPNDGRLAAVTSVGGALILDPTGKQIAAYAAATATILPELQIAVFSPDGTLLLTAGKGSSAQILDAGTGALKDILTDGHTTAIRTAAFSPDGKWVVTGSYDDTARVWQVAAGVLRVATVLSGDTEPVTNVAFAAGFTGATAPDDRVVTTSEDGTARTWEWGYSPGVPYPLPGTPAWMVGTPGATADPLYLTLDGDGTAVAWDYPNPQGARFAQLGPAGSAAAIAAAPDGTLVTVDQLGTARLWFAGVRAQLGTTLGAPIAPSRTLSAPAAPSSAASAACQSASGGVSVDVSRDGSTLAVAGPDDQIRLWNPGSGALLDTLRVGASGCPISQVQLSTHGLPLAAVNSAGSAAIWHKSGNGSAGATQLALPSGLSVKFLALSPDGRTLFTGNSDGSISKWDGSGRLLVREMHLSSGPPLLKYSNDGSRLLVAEQSSEPMLWDPADTSEHAAALSAFGAVATQWIWVTFSDDGRWVVTTHTDGSVRIWDSSSDTGQAAAVSNGHDGLSVAAMSGDGRSVVTFGLDQSVRSYTCDFCGPLDGVLQVAVERLKAQPLTPEQQRFLAQQ